jgi:hypothetical protein
MRFVPSSYQRDLRNRLHLLKQGKKSIDEYFKEMELLLVRTRIRKIPCQPWQDSGFNEEIFGFVEMFPYHTLQDLVEQAMRTEIKFNKSHVENLMQVIIMLSHGANSNPVLLFVEDDPKEMQLGLIHTMVHQRWRLL